MIILSCALWANWLPLLVGASTEVLEYFSWTDKEYQPLHLFLRHYQTLYSLTVEATTSPPTTKAPVQSTLAASSQPQSSSLALPFRLLLHTQRSSGRELARCRSLVERTSLVHLYLDCAVLTNVHFDRLVYGTIQAYTAAFRQEESDYD